MIDQSKYNGDYMSYLKDHHPDVHQLWCDAMNANFDSIYLFEEGKIEESNKLHEKFKEYRDSFRVAFKLILHDFYDK